jgi:hypothetical protein
MQLKIRKRNAVCAGKTTYMQLSMMTGSNVWAANICCVSSVLHTKTNVLTAVGSYCERKQQDAEEGLENFLNCDLDSWVQWVSHTVSLCYIWCSSFDIASLLWKKFDSFHLLSLLLEFTWYFQRAASLPHKKRHLYRHIRERRHKDNFFSSSCILQGFVSAGLLHTT